MKPITCWLLCGVLLLALGACGGDDISSLLNEVGGGPIIVGNAATPTGNLTWGASILTHGPYTLGVDAQLQSLNVYVASVATSTQVRLGIYGDSGGVPGLLVISPPAQPVTAGLNTVNFPTPLPLTAGAYWLGVQMDSTLDLGVIATLRDYYYQSVTFGSPWPNPYSPTGPFNVQQAVIYMVLSN